MISQKLTTCGVTKVVTTATTIPVMPKILPVRAVSGEERPRSAMMKAIDAKR